VEVAVDKIKLKRVRTDEVREMVMKNLNFTR